MEKRGRSSSSRKRRLANIGEEGEGDSSNLRTPTTPQQATNHASPPPQPQGDIYAPQHSQSATPKYPTRLFGQCVDSTTNPLRYPVRSNRWTPTDCSATKVAEKFLAESTHISDQATNDIQTSEEWNSELPPQTEVSNSMATSMKQIRINEKKKSVKNGETIENPDTSMSAESDECSTPTSKDMWDFVKSAVKPLSQTNELVNHHPTGDCTVMPNISRNIQEQSEINSKKMGEHLTSSQSLNLTEIAKMTHSDCSDEVGTAFNSAPVSVDGYVVKPEMATTLEAIFLKHGDIAKGSSLRSAKSRSSLLEMVCDIVQKLQETRWINRINPAGLKSMVDVVIDLESMGLELGWLHKRLDEISEALKSINGSSTLKEAKKSSTAAIERKERDLESYKAEMLVLKNKICLAQDEVAAVKAEDEKINILISDTKAKVKNFYQRSLVDGLL